jgi:serine protease inhibitor
MTMRFPITLSFSIAVSSILAASLGCGTGAVPAADTESECATTECGVASAQERVEAAPPADVALAVRGNTAFALDLYRALAAEPGNLFFSPFSISETLAMTSAGARGATEREMARALHLDLPQERLHPAFETLARSISTPLVPGRGADGGRYHLTLASSLWDQQGYPLALSFLDTLTRSYRAQARVVDFVGDTEGARSAINTWMTASTGQRIPDLLPPGAISSTTRLVLGNAVHFSAAWKTPFDPADSRILPFTRRDGSTIEVPTMTGTQNLAYGEGPDFAAVALPYDTGELSMVLFAPKQGTLDAFEASLTPERLTSIVDGLERRSVAITLPAFRIESSLALEGHLARLGMPTAFTDAADFSGISGRRGLALDAVVHQTFVDVDEAGTEAAAATATGFTTTAAYLPAEIRFDQPYLFLIRDAATGTVVFLGRVEDPSL